MTGRTYASPVAMRAALEQRLRDRHDSTHLPLDRLRKEAALQRLLARIAAVAPPGSWALKGGLAMIARLGERARATADADATWRAGRPLLRDMLDRASEQDLSDHFEFTIGQASAISRCWRRSLGGERWPGAGVVACGGLAGDGERADIVECVAEPVFLGFQVIS